MPATRSLHVLGKRLRMPVVLSQHFSPADRVYLDVEGALYHYPRQYFARVRPFERFVYYRPLGKSAHRADSRHYFGYGMLGDVTPDPSRQDHRFVDVAKYEPFKLLVPLRDAQGNYYETGTLQIPQMQLAVREISEIAYHRMLAAAGVADTGISLAPNTEEVATGLFVGRPLTFPKDQLRELREIPKGAGYMPTGALVDVYEAAALQERARADRQRVLADITARIQELGGSTWYNNNIDLFATLGDHKMLVEAKSLNDRRRAVDRMRYGMGQLFDYRVRYEAEVGDALPILAFGRPPTADAAWVGRILDGNGVALVSRERENLIPLNRHAESLPFLS